MVDPIRSSSPAPWNPALSDDPDRHRAGTSTRSRPVPDLPDLPDVNAALLARAARAAAAAPRQPWVAPARVDASTVVTDADTPVQRRLQAFFEAATPVYQVPDGKGGTVEIAVATPFRMV